MIQIRRLSRDDLQKQIAQAKTIAESESNKVLNKLLFSEFGKKRRKKIDLIKK